MIKSMQITQWNDPAIDIYKKFYNFLNHVDPSKVQFFLNMRDDHFDNLKIEKNIVVISTANEAPRN